MNNVRNWLLGTAAIVIATSLLLTAFKAESVSEDSRQPVVDSMQAPAF